MGLHRVFRLEQRKQQLNSLTPGRCSRNLWSMIFKPIIQNSSLVIYHEITFEWIPKNRTNETSTLVQVMAWCHQAKSHCLRQCWPRFISSRDITRPQWVKISQGHVAQRSRLPGCYQYLNRCCLSLYGKSYIHVYAQKFSFQENDSEKVVHKMLTILLKPQCS